MKVRLAQAEDLSTLQEIYNHARTLMRQSGNMTQWTNGYPQKELLLQDITDSNCYVIEHNNEIVGVFALISGDDPTYKHIYNGQWLNDAPYATIHRVATTSKIKGIASFCFDWCLKKSGNIRIDTHEDNKIMQHILEKKGFTKCGIIYINDGTPRIAYQKINSFK